MYADDYQVSSTLQTRIANEIHAPGESSLQLNLLDYTARATLNIIGPCCFWSRLHAVCGDAPDAIKISNTIRTQNEMACKQSTFAGLLILRLFPCITSLPLKAVQAQGAVADTIRRLAKNIVANSQVDNKGKGKDLMLGPLPASI